MENERILRTSVFGGFKKEDVLKYVEELKAEISTLTEEIKEKANTLSDLSDRVDALSAECEEGKVAQEKLSETKEQVIVLETENQQLREDNLALSKRMATLDEEEARLQSKAEEVKASEAQLGAAFLDARKYSDEIVTAANKKANETQSEASDSIATQAAEIARLSSDVDVLSETLTKSIEALHADISTLSAKLSKAAQSLKNRKDAEKFIPDISMKIEEELGETITGVTETNDGSGLTFIHYPSHTDFNEDLNIKSDSIYHFGNSKEG